MKTLDTIKNFLKKPLLKFSPLLFSLFLASCNNNSELREYNNNTQYINQDFDNFLEEYGTPEKDKGLSYRANINGNEYVSLKSGNSVVLSLNGSRYWVDMNLDGMKQTFISKDSYKDMLEKEDKNFDDFSDKEQLEIAQDYIKAKLYILHKAGYKNY